MARRRTPLFVERETYRRRRLIDAARILPVAGLVALLLPVLWSQSGQTSTANEALYLFGLWFAMILAARMMARPLREEVERDAAAPPTPPPGPPP